MLVPGIIHGTGIENSLPHRKRNGRNAVIMSRNIRRLRVYCMPKFGIFLLISKYVNVKAFAHTCSFYECGYQYFTLTILSILQTSTYA